MTLLEGKLIYSCNEVQLKYIEIIGAYQIIVPYKDSITVPKENIEDMQRIFAAAKDHRDFGTIEEDY